MGLTQLITAAATLFLAGCATAYGPDGKPVARVTWPMRGEITTGAVTLYAEPGYTTAGRLADQAPGVVSAVLRKPK